MPDDDVVSPSIWIADALDGRAIARPATRPPCDCHACVHAEAMRVRARLDAARDYAIDVALGGKR